MLWATLQEPIAARVRPQIRQAASRERPPRSLQRTLHDALVAHTQVDLLLDEMISQRYRLDQLGDAFDDMHHGRIAKGVIEFD